MLNLNPIKCSSFLGQKGNRENGGSFVAIIIVLAILLAIVLTVVAYLLYQNHELKVITNRSKIAFISESKEELVEEQNDDKDDKIEKTAENSSRYTAVNTKQKKEVETQV